jgi:G:T-mismatch repair DNA endonuclease (very short patch repair protein)
MKKTRMRLQYIVELGYDIEVMWECEWNRRVREDGDVGRFVKTLEEVWYPKWCILSTEQQVKKAVEDGQFFGLVRCDISSPPELSE